MLSSRIDMGTVRWLVGERCGPVGFYVLNRPPAIGSRAELSVGIVRCEALDAATGLPQEQPS